MICNRCGRSFPGSQVVQDIRCERVGDGDLRMVPISLCPDCATGRGATLMLYVYFFAFFAALLIPIFLIRAIWAIWTLFPR